jgi:hypothetical protein
MLTVLARLTHFKTICRDFNHVTFIVRVCRVVTCEYKSCNMKFGVGFVLNYQHFHGHFLGISLTLLNKPRIATGYYYPMNG